MDRNTKVPICGYEVVRKPEFNFEPANDSGNEPFLRTIDGVPYSGINRMEWFDISKEEMYGKLPPDIASSYKVLYRDQPYGTALLLTQRLDLAMKLLAYSNRDVARNEIIAIFAPELVPYTGQAEGDKFRFEYLGSDVVLFGSYSLLFYGMFYHPAAFLPFKHHLNRNGLFDSQAAIQQFIEFYHSVRSDRIEPISPGARILAIRIYRFRDEAGMIQG
ncbi:MAG TPA: hypothetical protein VHD56_04415 [Tepidisphaeraceae bacterium]|nr:hypothetical protein [Tepidisphaeraceae bacterium]